MAAGALFLLIGNVIYALAQWGVVITIARLGSLEQQGAYSYALALLAPLTMLVRCNLRAVLATDHHDEFGYQEYYLTRLISTAVPAVVVVIVVMFSFTDLQMVLMAGCLGLLKAVEGLSDIAYGQLQRDHSLKRLSLLIVLRSAALFLVFLFGFFVAGTVWIPVITVTGLWLAIHLYLDPRPDLTVESLRPVLATASLITKKCWPLGLSMAFVALFNYVPLFFLGIYSDLEVVGAFAAVNYVWLIGVFLATSISQAIASKMARLFYEDFRQYLRNLGLVAFVLVMVGVVISIPIAVYSDDIVVLAYGDQYTGLGPLLVIISAAIVLNILLSILGLNLTIAREFRGMLTMNAVSVFAIAGFGWLLVPEMLAIGAAYTLIAGLVVKLVISTLLGWVVVSRHWSRGGNRNVR